LNQRPFFKVYPGDEARHGTLLLRSELFALYWKIRIRSHDCERIGYLSRNGTPIPDTELSEVTGLGVKEFTALSSELVVRSLLARSRDGILYDPVIVEQAKAQGEAKKFGRMGGSPILRDGLSPPLPQGNGVSDYDYDTEPSEPAGLPEGIRSKEFLEVWLEFERHRREIKRPMTGRSRKQLLLAMKGIGQDRAILAIRHSIANGWQGIFEPKNAGRAFQPPRRTFAP
jgi:hypothetical protein